MFSISKEYILTFEYRIMANMKSIMNLTHEEGLERRVVHSGCHFIRQLSSCSEEIREIEANLPRILERIDMTSSNFNRSISCPCCVNELLKEAKQTPAKYFAYTEIRWLVYCDDRSLSFDDEMRSRLRTAVTNYGSIIYDYPLFHLIKGKGFKILNSDDALFEESRSRIDELLRVLEPQR